MVLYLKNLCLTEKSNVSNPKARLAAERQAANKKSYLDDTEFKVCFVLLKQHHLPQTQITKMNYHFRKATLTEIAPIWIILQQAIQRRKQDGSNQWQDGYPNPEVIQKDIETGEGFVLVAGETIVGYSAVLINDEPAYDAIEGSWLTNDDFVVMHRVAIAESYLGKGLAKLILKHIEDFALSNNINSIKADTNFDNIAMIKIFETLGYIYCGEVYFRGSPRKAYEKVLNK